ncbi:hypothetical protein ACFL1M_03465 [Patescibacteria group bacterium]
MMRQTWMLIGLTLVILYSIFRWGIPAIVNMAVFLGDLKSSSEPITQEDTIPPVSPRLEQLPSATTSARLNLSGYTESEASVKLYRLGAELSETVADDDGDFEFVDIRLDDDENTFYTVATDFAGNESDQSNRVTISYDTDAPDLSINSPSDGDEYYGDSERTITISGFADPDVEVRVNDFYAVVSSQGSFSTRIKLEEGDNRISIRAIDDAGNETEKVVTVRFSL